MSLLHPIRIDRYVLYLDKLTIIKIDDENPNFYKCHFIDMDTLHLLRSYKDELEAKLPSCFMRYEEMWINDFNLKYMDSTWDTERNKAVLITKFRRSAGISQIVEYGTLEEINAKMEQRIQQSISSLLTYADEIGASTQTVVEPIIQEAVTPIITQQVTQQITQQVSPIVQQSVTNEVAQQVKIDDMGAYFNNALGAKE